MYYHLPIVYLFQCTPRGFQFALSQNCLTIGIEHFHVDVIRIISAQTHFRCRLYVLGLGQGHSMFLTFSLNDLPSLIKAQDIYKQRMYAMPLR